MAPSHMILIWAISLILQSPATQSAPAAQIACNLLTQAQVTQATSAAVGAGTPISTPTSCQWSGGGKMVTLTITQTLSGKSPLQQFDLGKTRTLPGVTIEPVSGVGDDAYYVYFAGQNRTACGLLVKKDAATFEIRVYGFDLAQAKGVAKTLAAAAVAKF